jgi:predicted small metal-binding protein
MKVVHCPCGDNVEAEDETTLVERVNEHISDKHPEMAGKYTSEQIISMAHDH